MLRLSIAALLISAGGAGSQPAAASQAAFKAGVAKIDITPAPGNYLMGSGEVKAEGVLDPLYARVLVLEAAGRRVALVAVDLCRVFQAPLIAQLRERVRAASGVSYLLISATHTHSGPTVPLSEEMPLDDITGWQKPAIEKIAGAVADAAAKLVPVRIGTGYGVAHIGHNRRRLNPDGTVTMFFANPARIPTSPVDPTVAVVRLDTADGRPFAILVHYACHPVVVMGGLKKYTADYPGVMAASVEAAFDGEPMCLFLQGAAGDIDTYHTNVPAAQDPLGKLKWSGERLGREAARVAASIRTDAPSEPSLDFREDLIAAKWRWAPGKFEALMRKLNPPALAPYYMPDVKPELHLPVSTLLVNRKIAFLGWPGEPFVDFQMDFRARCPAEDCLFLGYANGFVSYLPTIKAAVEGGHGGALWTRVEPGTGERLLNHGIVKIYEMLGRLKDAPEPPRR